MKKFSLALCLLLITAWAPARSHASDAVDIGQGALFCQKYAKLGLDKKNDYIIWVQGFVSAYNALDPNTFNILGVKDWHFVRQWLDDYCKANPEKYFGEAVRVLIEELYPNRVPSEQAVGGVTINIDALKNYKKSN